MIYWRFHLQFTVKEYSIYNEQEILHLYDRVGWTNYTSNPFMLANAYKHSLKVLGAYDEDKLIGIIRTVGDGYSMVYIQDIIVLPEYQRKGIGTLLLQQILFEYKHVYQKALMTDNTEKTIQFYKSVGFVMDTDIDCRAFLKIY
jgi:GNAT superfamily N-acetyltransferase